MSELNELKPCPNPECGGPAIMSYGNVLNEHDHGGAFVRCSQCDLSTGYYFEDGFDNNEFDANQIIITSNKSAAKAWNSLPRTSPEVDHNGDVNELIEPRKVDPEIRNLVQNLQEVVDEIDPELLAPLPCKTINAGIEAIKALYEKCDQQADMIQQQQAEIKRLNNEFYRVGESLIKSGDKRMAAVDKIVALQTRVKELEVFVCYCIHTTGNPLNSDRDYLKHCRLIQDRARNVLSNSRHTDKDNSVQEDA